MATHENPIPLLDLSNATPQELSKAVGDAVRNVGFLHVKGLPVSREEVARMFAISKELFASPKEELLACPTNGRNGFQGFGANRLDESKGKGDLKSNFVYGRYDAPDTETKQPLPPVMVKYKAEVDAFHKACYEITCRLLDAFSVALGLPVDYFRERHSPGGCGMALIDYPAVPASEVSEEGPARASAHKDWGSVTLLFQEEDGTPGLEINYKGKWYTAPIIPDTCLVNVGLALEKWTGNQFTATLHRVVTHQLPEGGFKARRSIAYFVQPRDEVVFNTISSDGTIIPSPNAMTSRAFFDERMNTSTRAAGAEIKAY